MNQLILPAMILIPVLLFNKDGLGIQLHTKVDMPLNKQN